MSKNGSSEGNHIKAYTSIMAICAILMIVFTLYSFIAGMGRQGEVMAATAARSERNELRLDEARLMLERHETQLCELIEIKQQLKQIAGNISQIKVEMGELRGCGFAKDDDSVGR